MTVNMLKIKVEKEFNIPTKDQRWILGKSFATNPDASLATYGITSSGCPIFLYLITHEPNGLTENKPTTRKPQNDRNDQNLETIKNNSICNDGIHCDPIIESKLIKNDFIDNELNEDAKLADVESKLKEHQKTYRELIQLDDFNYVANSEPFDCSICFMRIEKGDGIVLRDCLHTFCK